MIKKILLSTIGIFLLMHCFAQNELDNFFNNTEKFLQNNVKEGRIQYDVLQGDEMLSSLVNYIAAVDLSHFDKNTRKAFLINVYNLLVIDGVVQAMPIASVQEVASFFDNKKYIIGGEKISLNQLEKEWLIQNDQDARLHFVLVCGALGCPPIIPKAYRPESLDTQLQQQTKIALNNPDFIQENESEGKIALSQIFKWYAADFGGKKEIPTFINRFREKQIDKEQKISHYPYDWALNQTKTDINSGTGNNATRYVVSSAIPKGGIEIKLFNNLYTQKAGSGMGDLTNRSTFFTSSLSAIYGLTSRFNIGFDLRYRRVHNAELPDSPLKVFSSGNQFDSRQLISTIGPKIRWAPIPVLENFSIQSAFWFPVGTDLEGGTTDEPVYIDWNKSTWWTQFFNDFSIGDDFSVFTEVDVLLEDIGDLNRFSTPATLIFSYFPNPKTTVYTLSGYSPYWQDDFDYFFQAGIGTKYQFSPNFEVELLYTYFTNKYLNSIDGKAATWNIGVRYSK